MRALIDWKNFGVLLALGVLGTVAVMPYALALQAEALADVPISMPVIVLLSLVQSAVLLSVAIAVGLVVSKRVGLQLPLLDKLMSLGLRARDLSELAKVAIPAGIFVGLAIIFGDWVFIRAGDLNFAVVELPIWKGALASLYGGIVEEILIRLFLMSVMVWVFGFIWKPTDGKPSATAVWIAIIASAVLFGLGHLPATALLVELTPLVVLRAVVLNGIGGLVFGWLFWKRGLMTAMLAHFSADIVLQVGLPIIRAFF